MLAELTRPPRQEKQLIVELDLLRKEPATFATWIRSNRQNLYKGSNLELLKDDLKTKVLLATHDGRKACLAAITALDKTRALMPYEHKAGLNAVSADTASEMAEGKGKSSTALVLMECGLLPTHPSRWMSVVLCTDARVTFAAAN